MTASQFLTFLLLSKLWHIWNGFFRVSFCFILNQQNELIELKSDEVSEAELDRKETFVALGVAEFT